VWEGTYCYKAMFGAWVLAGVATVAAAVAAVLFWATGIVPLVAGGLVVLLWLYLAALGLYRRWSVRYRLTNHRFFHEMGLLRRVTDRIEVIDMDDITFEQGPIERLLGVGTIRITSSDRTHPELVIRGIDNVREVAGQMDNLRREERIRRGLHIEAV
jgi:membrane protein YdbS with pleckstrin-like domain